MSSRRHQCLLLGLLLHLRYVVGRTCTENRPWFHADPCWKPLLATVVVSASVQRVYREKDHRYVNLSRVHVYKPKVRLNKNELLQMRITDECFDGIEHPHVPKNLRVGRKYDFFLEVCEECKQLSNGDKMFTATLPPQKHNYKTQRRQFTKIVKRCRKKYLRNNKPNKPKVFSAVQPTRLICKTFERNSGSSTRKTVDIDGLIKTTEQQAKMEEHCVSHPEVPAGRLTVRGVENALETLPCLLSQRGFPAPRLYWTGPDGELIDDSRLSKANFKPTDLTSHWYILKSNSSQKGTYYKASYNMKKPLALEDKGRYSCHVETPFRHLKTSVRLTVKERRKFNCKKRPYQCRNNGRCLTSNDRAHRCDCSPINGGVLCETPVATYCEVNTCLNGGTCLQYHNSIFASPTCLCPANFEGSKCYLPSNLGVQEMRVKWTLYSGLALFFSIWALLVVAVLVCLKSRRRLRRRAAKKRRKEEPYKVNGPQLTSFTSISDDVQPRQDVNNNALREGPRLSNSEVPASPHADSCVAFPRNSGYSVVRAMPDSNAQLTGQELQRRDRLRALSSTLSDLASSSDSRLQMTPNNEIENCPQGPVENTEKPICRQVEECNFLLASTGCDMDDATTLETSQRSSSVAPKQEARAYGKANGVHDSENFLVANTAL